MTRWRISELDQVTSLTRGVALPLPPIGQQAIDIILEAIASAWEQLQLGYMHVLVMGTEVEISTLLINLMNEALGSDDDGGLGVYVSSVSRGSEQINFNGEKLELRPDIQFALTRLDTRFRLIVECKLIDLKAKKTPALYRDHGIKRFVDGDYAWACQEAIMLAYVRCATSRLEPSVLSGLMGIPDMQCVAQSMQLSSSGLIKPDALGTSSHDRKFQYVPAQAVPPGKIDLWHLWLEV
ncbi:hypothetical protein ROSA5918_03125 [Roseateles saccharophilus]|uniref:Uncharacterized protein n=1 Tax=Roseateles saccharophilus TaxID=304 RepID=A0A4R3VKI8_ROSSA|nr:hypothetical protein EV671_1001143 [Roseateles saccharophilus]